MNHHSGDLSASAEPRRSQWLGRITASAALVLIAVVVLSVALRRTTLSYVTPAGPNRAPEQHSVVWTPGVVATVVSCVAAFASIGLAVRTWLDRRTDRMWWCAVAGLVLLAAVWTSVTLTLDTPNY